MTAEIEERLERFVELFLARNAALNLSAARDPEAVREHVRDSLSLVPHVLEPLVDIGSGGGFPALPIAIATGIRVTLVESMLKKARYLEAIVADLGLEAVVRVRAERAEDAARDPELREAFGSATARAVASLTTVIELTIPFLRVGGAALLQRGRLDARERAAGIDAALVLGAEVESEVTGGVEGDERRIVVVRKRLATGPRFPRRAGIPARRPLCWEPGSV